MLLDILGSKILKEEIHLRDTECELESRQGLVMRLGLPLLAQSSAEQAAIRTQLVKA